MILSCDTSKCWKLCAMQYKQYFNCLGHVEEVLLQNSKMATVKICLKQVVFKKAGRRGVLWWKSVIAIP